MNLELSQDEVDLLVQGLFALEHTVREIGGLSSKAFIGDIAVLVVTKEDAIRTLRERIWDANRGEEPQ